MASDSDRLNNNDKYDRLSDLLGPEYAEKWNSLSKAYAICEAQLAEHNRNNVKEDKPQKVFTPSILQRRMWQFIGNENEQLPLAVVKVDNANDKHFEAWVRVDPSGKSIERHHLLNLFETGDSKEAISLFLNLVKKIRFHDSDANNAHQNKGIFMHNHTSKCKSEVSISKMSTLINKEIINNLKDCEMNTEIIENDTTQVKVEEISVSECTTEDFHTNGEELVTAVEVSRSVTFPSHVLLKESSHKRSTSTDTSDTRRKCCNEHKTTKCGGIQLKRLQSRCLSTHSEGVVPSYKYRLAEISQPAISRTGLLAFAPHLPFIRSPNRPAFNLYYKL